MSEACQQPNEMENIKIEAINTAMEADDSRWSPKSPLPQVGAIVISDEESMEETDNVDEWTSPVLGHSQTGSVVHSPPASPNYQSGSDESTEDANNVKKIDWKGSLNLACLNPIKLFSNESFSPIALKAITCTVKTTTEPVEGIRVHEIRPSKNIWFEDKFRKVHIISGSIGVVLQAKIEMVTNIVRERRSLQRPILHLTNILNAETEYGEEIELSNQQLHVIARTHANTQNLQMLESRRAIIYLKPKAPFADQYNQTSQLDQSISKFWPTRQQELPLSTAKILKILHSRHERKTHKTSPSTTSSQQRNYKL